MSKQVPELKPCLCTFAQRVVGDGCYICNPELAAELAESSEDESMSEQLQERISPIADIKQQIADAADKDQISPYLVPWIEVLLINAYSRGWDNGFDKGKEIFGGSK